jgi:hypothetical protein
MSDIEVRVSLVEQNYVNLEKRMEKVEEKLDQLSETMRSNQHSLVKVIVGSAGTIVTGLLSLIVVILLG